MLGRTKARMLRAGLAALLALVAFPAAASAADSDAVATSKVFAPIGDLNDYFLAPGGDFEGKAKTNLKAAIQDAQRKWIAFRDADCYQAVGQEWGSGTGGPYAIYTCLTEKTLARTKELDARPH